jgi:anti-anti-sigma regulatory factor
MGRKAPSLAEPVVVANGKKETRVTLGPVLDIRAATALRDGLQKALKRGRPVIVDAAQVDRLSTPCIQVLLAAGRHAESASCRLVLAQASDPFIAAFGDLGLFADIMRWQAEA